MSIYTGKIGYTVRYGGPEGIQWIKTGEAAGSPLGSFNPAMAGNPVGLVIEATKAAALVLQWVEMRKQTLLQTAQFEERRIPWLADMLLQWSSEVQDGLVRLDTSLYFDREVTRLLDKIEVTKLMDVPSSLLLQMERTAQAMSAVNRLLYGQLQAQSPNFIMPGRDGLQLIAYEPYWELAGNAKEMETYLDRIDKNLGFIGNAAIGATFGLIGVAAWKVARAAAEKKNRLDEFQSLTAVALELRSLRAQLSYATLLPTQEIFLALPDSQPARLMKPQAAKSATPKKEPVKKSRLR